MINYRFANRFLAGLVVATVAVTVAGAQTPKPPTPAPAQTPAPVTKSATATITAVIQAIDSKARLVTLKAADGTIKTIECGPEVQRFAELKVGDTVTFNYTESIVFAITAPGAPETTPSAAGIVRSGGTRPGGAIAQRITAVVTVLAIDQAVPSITIQRQDGSKASFKVEDKKNIEGVKVGDKVQITYTQALAISVK